MENLTAVLKRSDILCRVMQRSVRLRVSWTLSGNYCNVAPVHGVQYQSDHAMFGRVQAVVRGGGHFVVGCRVVCLVKMKALAVRSDLTRHLI